MDAIEITVCPDQELGTWQGMGGAITEATAYNFSKLSPEKQKKLLSAYYGKDGLDYRWCRISVGSNDFCLKSYDYTKKTNLKDFSIDHDRQWVLPMLKLALKQKKLTILASPWSPPSCMKLFRMRRFGGRLLPWHYKNYARYIRKWIDTYADEGIHIDYLSPQNEPRAAQVWESSKYSFRNQRKLAYKYLAPALKNCDTKLLLWDHNKKHLAATADKLFCGKFVTKYGCDEKVAGICYHWYDGTCPDEMLAVRQRYPEIMMVSSEMCCGFSSYDKEAWQADAKKYCYELMTDINCGTCAWLDWNMLLSWQGGPSYCRNFVKSPVILNEAEDDFILTPIYDSLKKFAKLFPAGSKIVHCQNSSTDVAAVARKTASGIEVVVANVSNHNRTIIIHQGRKEKQITLRPGEIKGCE